MSLIADLGIGDRELVSFVGAGGKTTLLLDLGRELKDLGRSVVLGTTTRMGTDQIPSWADVGQPDNIGPAATFVVESTEGPKVIGSQPEVFDKIFESTNHVLVEADGARRRQIKAPTPHEPVIPSRTTTVVLVAGTDALGRPISDVAHRPERVAEVLGMSQDDLMTPEAMTRLVTNVEGGLARVPQGARVVVALTGKGTDSAGVNQVVLEISTNHRIDRVATKTSSREDDASSFEEVWK